MTPDSAPRADAAALGSYASSRDRILLPPGEAEVIRRLGRFQVLELVGQGSYGTVCRAWDPQLQHFVALKELLPGARGASTYAERARREARAAVRLHHTGIVRLYETLTLEGRPVLVYDFIHGISLEKLFESRRLTFSESARLVADVADALAYAHSLKVVHRDIKPGNIMIACPGTPGTPLQDVQTVPLDRPVIVDFGLALREEAETTLTVEGQLVGTFAYMSPEQATGLGHRADGRSDVYSLGIVLYKMLAGELPFKGPKVTVLNHIVHSEPRRLRRINREIPRDLESVCLKAIEKQPDRRYKTARDFADDLRRFLRDEPTLARPIGTLERLGRWGRRNKLVAGLAVLPVVVGILFGAWTLAFAVGEHRAKLQSQRQQYGIEIKQAQQEWKAGQLLLTQQRLDNWLPPNEPPGGRGFEWHYLKRMCGLELQVLSGQNAAVLCLAVSPDGRWLASGGDDGSIIVRDLATGNEAFPLPGHTGVVIALAFSPDGKCLASAGGDLGERPGHPPGEAKLWNLQTRSAVPLFPEHRIGIYRGVAFSKDGRYLACGGGGHERDSGQLPGKVYVWDLQERREACPPLGHAGVVWAMAFSPDSRQLATASEDEILRIWDVNRPQAPWLKLTTGSTAPLHCLAYGPDGQSLAAAGWDKTVRIWDVTRRNDSAGLPDLFRELWGGRKEPALVKPRLRLALKELDQPIEGLAYSPDGKRLASVGRDQVVRIWDTINGEQIQVWRGHVGNVWCIAFSPDGLRLISGGADRSIRIWDTSGNVDTVTLARNERAFVDANTVAISPDGRELITAGTDRGITIWNIDLALARDTWWGHTAAVNGLALSRDGKLLASASADRTVQIRSFPAGSVLCTLKGHQGAVSSVAFHPNNLELASGSQDGTLRTWDATTGANLRILRHGVAVSGLAYSPDGRSLASVGEDGSLRVWNASLGILSRTLSGHEQAALSVTFSSDGRWLASGGQDGKVILREYPSCKVIRELTGHTGAIRGIAFSADGERLFSASDDQTVRIWDTATGQLLLTLEGHEGDVQCVAVSSDGSRIASASKDGMARVWDAHPCTPERSAQYQAVALLASRIHANRSAAEVIAEIRTDPALSEPTREQALRLAEPYWRGVVHLAALQWLKPLTIDRCLPRTDLLAEVEKASDLPEAVRQEARSLAARYIEDPARLNESSWTKVCRPGQSVKECELARRQAEIAVNLSPEVGDYLVTYGMARYRLGNYREAAEALARADALTLKGDLAAAPARLAFLAMARYRLRDKDVAQASLKELQSMMQEPHWARQEQAVGFLKEAESVLALP